MDQIDGKLCFLVGSLLVGFAGAEAGSILTVLAAICFFIGTLNQVEG